MLIFVDTKRRQSQFYDTKFQSMSLFHARYLDLSFAEATLVSKVTDLIYDFNFKLYEMSKKRGSLGAIY